MSVVETLRCIYETMAIATPTVVEAATGRLEFDTIERRLESWAIKVVDHARIRLDVHGQDDVDWSRAYVIMSNHQSHFDIPVLYRTVRGPMRMVAKQELFHLPIFGRAMREARFPSIDRANRKNAIAALQQATELIRSGIHVWIAPEGTRSKTGAIGPLKKGGFRMAIDTETPILPVAISGTVRVLRPGTASVHMDQTVRVVFGRPIEVEGRDVPDLLEEVRAFFETNVAR